MGCSCYTVVVVVIYYLSLSWLSRGLGWSITLRCGFLSLPDPVITCL